MNNFVKLNLEYMEVRQLAADDNKRYNKIFGYAKEAAYKQLTVDCNREKYPQTNAQLSDIALDNIRALTNSMNDIKECNTYKNSRGTERQGMNTYLKESEIQLNIYKRFI